ncbi:MAG: DUF2304 domain-containing protein [bacterium]|nr:DUF2304 domain-containing protein [bacterium]
MLIQFFLLFLMACAFFVTWRRVHQRIIHVREALGWSAVWIVASVVVLRPEMTTRIANLFGVGRGVDFVLYASVAIVLLLIFRLFLQHEKLERTITLLIRESALHKINQEPPHQDAGSRSQDQQDIETV